MKSPRSNLVALRHTQGDLCWICGLPLWLMHGRTDALVFNRQTVSLDLQNGIRGLQLADMGHAGFTRMDQNLRPTQTK